MNRNMLPSISDPGVSTCGAIDFYNNINIFNAVLLRFHGVFLLTFFGGGGM